MELKSNPMSVLYNAVVVPNEVAPKNTAFWNGNYCFYSNGSPNSFYYSAKEKSYGNTFTFFIYGESMFSLPNHLQIDSGSSYLYTFISDQCNQLTCKIANLNKINIANNNFICPKTRVTKMSPTPKTLWKNGLCFYTPPKHWNPVCFYPDVDSHRSTAVNAINPNNIDNDDYCYGFYSTIDFCLPHQCNTNYLSQIKVQENNFFCNKTIPTVVSSDLAAIGDAYWNGNLCFYSSCGTHSNKYYSLQQKSYNNFSFYNVFVNKIPEGYEADGRNNKLYSHYSTLCNQRSCVRENLFGAVNHSLMNFTCPRIEPTQLASDNNNVLWKNGVCFYKPIGFSTNDLDLMDNQCFYPQYINYSQTTPGLLIYDNIDNNNFCYPYVSKTPYCTIETCNKKNLNIVLIDENNFFCPVAPTITSSASQWFSFFSWGIILVNFFF